MNNILVLGGTGFVGQVLCEHLVRRPGGSGGRIVVPTRQLQRGRAIQFLPTVEVVQADVHDPAQLKRLLAGCDAVVNLVAILHGDEAAFEQVHVALPQKLAEACRAQGVRRVLHVSALGAGKGAPSMYQRSKAAGEAVWQPSGLDVTVLRPSVIFGAGDHFLNLFARLQALLPVLPLAGAHAQFQPVWVGDVAEALVHCLARPATVGQVYEAVGPTQYTLTQLVQLAGHWAGHRRPVVALPDGLARLQAQLMEWLPGEPLLSRDNLDAMKTPNVATGKFPTLEALGLRPAALEAIGPQVLAGQGGPSRLNAWRRVG